MFSHGPTAGGVKHPLTAALAPENPCQATLLDNFHSGVSTNLCGEGSSCDPTYMRGVGGFSPAVFTCAPALGFDDWSTNGTSHGAPGHNVLLSSSSSSTDAPRACRDYVGMMPGAMTLDDTYWHTNKAAEKLPPAQHQREMDEGRVFHGFDANCHTVPLLREGRGGGCFFD